jgi:hypothetical protein
MNIAECEKQAKNDYEKRINDHKAGIEKDAALKVKYEAMLAEVDAYIPPSPDHVEFKKFMRDQIIESIKSDCAGNYHQDALKKLWPLSGMVWRQLEIGKCFQDIFYSTKEQEKENRRATERTKWIQQLRASI